MARFDTLIHGGTVIDGTRLPRLKADVGIKNGRVTKIGRIDSDDADQILDATGHIVAPGFVDLHTHYDAQLLWDSTASPSPALGVTTVVIGNCGFGIVPAPPEHRGTILANLAEVEGMSLASLQAGVNWTFESFGEYLDTLRGKWEEVLAEEIAANPDVAALWDHWSKFHADYQVWGSRGYLKN